MSIGRTARTGVAAGIPFIAMPPDDAPESGAPAVFAWHLMDPPRTERAFAAALPLSGLPVWRIYLGLPLSGARLPDGGLEELQRLGYEDAVEHLHGPVVLQGAAEFPGAYAYLRPALSFSNGPIGVVGGSDGAALAQLVIAEAAPSAGIDVAAAVLVSPVTELATTVDALATRYGFTYEWSNTTRAIADRLDFVSRAARTAIRQPAVRLIVGAEDDRIGIIEPAQRLQRTLRDRYDDPARIDLVEVAGMGHSLAEEPGTDPAPQSPHAAEVDRLAVQWLHHFLIILEDDRRSS